MMELFSIMLEELGLNYLIYFNFIEDLGLSLFCYALLGLTTTVLALFFLIYSSAIWLNVSNSLFISMLLSFGFLAAVFGKLFTLKYVSNEFGSFV